MTAPTTLFVTVLLLACRDKTVPAEQSTIDRAFDKRHAFLRTVVSF